MNKKLLKTILVGAASLSLAGCTGGQTSTTVSVQSVSLNASAVTIGIGDEAYHLVATINPEDATNKAVTWLANNEHVRVDARGYVTAVSEGESVVTVTTVDGGKTAQCSFSVVEVEHDLTFIGPVYKHQSYIDYETNIKTKAETKEEFVNREDGYFVGIDNAFNVKPQFTVYNAEGQRLNQDAWNHDYEIEVDVLQGELFVPASTDDYAITDAKNALIDFGPSAVDHTYRISVKPGNLPVEEREDPDNVAVYTVKVIEGYNAYTAKELSYLDSRHDDLECADWEAGDIVNKDFRKWDAFKTANGLDPEYDPKAVIMHENISVTQDDVPSYFFYHEGIDPEARVGDYETLKDTAHIYTHNLDTDLTFIGNYLTLDYSRIPLITRNEGTDEKPNSHTAFFRNIKGDFVVKNVNAIGNAPKASGEAENVNAGGLMFYKVGDDATHGLVENSIIINQFLTFFAEAELYPDKADTRPVFEIKDSKCYDDYSCFLYNSGCVIQATNCIFEGVGGPIVINDHSRIASNSTEYEAVTWHQVPTSAGTVPVPEYSIIGHPATTKLVDCELNNYVAGGEAWFKNYNAQPAVAKLQEMNMLMNMYGQTYMSKMNDDKSFTPIANNPLIPGAWTQTAFFNLISLNKSSKASALTEYPVCGDVEIINTKDEKVEVFDYSQPDTALFYEAIAEQSEPKLLVYAEQALQHGTIRTVNEEYKSAAMQTGYAGDDYYFYIGGSEENPVLMHQYNPISPSAEAVTPQELAQHKSEHLAIYYSGMQIIMGVYQLPTNS